jgi:serine/threonine protein kinase
VALSSVSGPAVGDVIAERFVVDTVLGRGGNAMVYRVLECGSNLPFALKLTRRTDRLSIAQLEHEADMLELLSPAGVGRCYERGALVDGRAFLVTEWIDGPTIGQLGRDGPLGIVNAFRVTLAISGVLSAMHSHEIIHCDVKPLNIIVPRTAGGIAFEESRLIDFGIARKLTARSETGDLRGPVGTWAGTADYMAPEQLAGRRTGLATDIYGLGATLFTMLYGRPPYEGGELEKVLPPVPGMPRPFMGSFVVRRLTESVAIPRDEAVPIRVRNLLTNMLCLRLEERIGSIEGVAQELRQALANNECSRPALPSSTDRCCCE